MNIEIVQGQSIDAPRQSNQKNIYIVIDVIRAFTTSVFALECPNTEVILVPDSDRARLLRSTLSNALLVGEEDGLPPFDFDLGNSPSDLKSYRFSDGSIILRTTNGVYATSNVIDLGETFVTGMLSAIDIIHYLLSRLEKDKNINIFLLATDRKGSDEDLACAEFIRDSLESGNPIQTDRYQQRIERSENALKYLNNDDPRFPLRDLKYCSQPKQKNFVMRAVKTDNQITLEKVFIYDAIPK